MSDRNLLSTSQERSKGADDQTSSQPTTKPQGKPFQPKSNPNTNINTNSDGPKRPNTRPADQPFQQKHTSGKNWRPIQTNKSPQTEEKPYFERNADSSSASEASQAQDHHAPKSVDFKANPQKKATPGQTRPFKQGQKATGNQASVDKEQPLQSTEIVITLRPHESYTRSDDSISDQQGHPNRRHPQEQSKKHEQVDGHTSQLKARQRRKDQGKGMEIPHKKETFAKEKTSKDIANPTGGSQEIHSQGPTSLHSEGQTQQQDADFRETVVPTSLMESEHSSTGTTSNMAEAKNEFDNPSRSLPSSHMDFAHPGNGPTPQYPIMNSISNPLATSTGPANHPYTHMSSNIAAAPFFPSPLHPNVLFEPAKPPGLSINTPLPVNLLSNIPASVNTTGILHSAPMPVNHTLGASPYAIQSEYAHLAGPHLYPFHPQTPQIPPSMHVLEKIFNIFRAMEQYVILVEKYKAIPFLTQMAIDVERTILEAISSSVPHPTLIQHCVGMIVKFVDILQALSLQVPPDRLDVLYKKCSDIISVLMHFPMHNPGLPSILRTTIERIHHRQTVSQDQNRGQTPAGNTLQQQQQQQQQQQEQHQTSATTSTHDIMVGIDILKLVQEPNVEAESSVPPISEEENESEESAASSIGEDLADGATPAPVDDSAPEAWTTSVIVISKKSNEDSADQQSTAVPDTPEKKFNQFIYSQDRSTPRSLFDAFYKAKDFVTEMAIDVQVEDRKTLSQRIISLGNFVYQTCLTQALDMTREELESRLVRMLEVIREEISMHDLKDPLETHLQTFITLELPFATINGKVCQPGQVPRQTLVLLNKSVHKFLDDMKIQLVKNERQEILEHLRRILVPAMGDDCMIDVYGSSAVGLSLPTSDIDFHIRLYDEARYKMNTRRMTEALRSTVKYLKKHNSGFISVQFINARIPIVRFVHRRSRTECDLAYYKLGNVQKTKFMEYYTNLDRRVKPFILLVKKWARVWNLNDAIHGTLNSFSITLMCLSLLQRRMPSIVPYFDDIRAKDTTNVHEMLNMQETCKFASTNQESLGDLFLAFFYHYGYTFDYSNPILVNSRDSPENNKEEWNGIGNNHLYIRDPFDASDNTARSVSKRNAVLFQRECRRAYDLLVEGADFKKLLELYREDKYE